MAERERAGTRDQADGGAAPRIGGAVIENPISGERILVRVSGAATDGRLLVFDLHLPPGAHVPAGHVHPAQEERFTVVSGRMRFRLGRRTVDAGPGDTVAIPRGASHWFGNAGDEDAWARVEVRPALRMEEMFRRTEALAGLGHLPGTRLPPLAHLAAVILDFQREVAVPHVPRAVVRAVLGPFAWWGHRRADGRGRGDGCSGSS